MEGLGGLKSTSPPNVTPHSLTSSLVMRITLRIHRGLTLGGAEWLFRYSLGLANQTHIIGLHGGAGARPADKNASRRRASEFFPDCADQWKLAKHDGRAEAAMLAWYGLGFVRKAAA